MNSVCNFKLTNYPQPQSWLPNQRIFFSYSSKYYDCNLSIIPCIGKQACIKWKTYQKEVPSSKIVSSWCKQYPNANIGVVTGEISNLTVVDIDSGKPEIINQTIERFGDTPIKVQTPSGGLHLYYSYNNEKCLTRIDGLPIDIRSEGGYIIAPPSYNAEKEKPYLFIEGNLSCLNKLPRIKSNALNFKNITNFNPDILNYDTVYEGQRNSCLFKALINRVKECNSYDDLEDSAYFYNQQSCVPPLEETEVQGLIDNVWSLKTNNKLYSKGDRFVTTHEGDLTNLKDFPRAFWLLMKLKIAHENRREKFAISPHAIAHSIGWDISTVRNARNTLVEKGYLRLVHQGGKHSGDCSVFKFNYGEV